MPLMTHGTAAIPTKTKEATEMMKQPNWIPLPSPRATELILNSIMPKVEALAKACPQSVGFSWQYPAGATSFSQIYLIPLQECEIDDKNPYHERFEGLVR